MELQRLHLRPTKDDVLVFADDLRRLYGVSIVGKRTAIEMRMVAAALESFGVIDTEDFLSRFSTYLFGRVYLPWKPGATGNPAREIITIAHEYGHAYQDGRSGKNLEFEIDYCDTGKRAVLEAECYAIGPCLSIRYPAAFPDSVENQVAQAIHSFSTGYGSIPKRDLDRFARELRSRVARYGANEQAWNGHLRRVTSILDRSLAR